MAVLGVAVLAVFPAQAQKPETRLVVLANVCMVEDTAFAFPAATVAGPVLCPAILYNPKRLLYEWSESTVPFIFLHEYAHLVLGHARAGKTATELQNQERAADCWAAPRFRIHWPEHWEDLLLHMRTVPGTGEHDAGPIRATHIRRCGGAG